MVEIRNEGLGSESEKAKTEEEYQEEANKEYRQFERDNPEHAFRPIFNLYNEYRHTLLDRYDPEEKEIVDGYLKKVDQILNKAQDAMASIDPNGKRKSPETRQAVRTILLGARQALNKLREDRDYKVLDLIEKKHSVKEGKISETLDSFQRELDSLIGGGKEE